LVYPVRFRCSALGSWHVWDCGGPLTRVELGSIPRELVGALGRGGQAVRKTAGVSSILTSTFHAAFDFREVAGFSIQPGGFDTRTRYSSLSANGSGTSVFTRAIPVRIRAGTSTGCSSAEESACFGRRRPQVRFLPPRLSRASSNGRARARLARDEGSNPSERKWRCCRRSSSVEHPLR
jgi:hypothetical protein